MAPPARNGDTANTGRIALLGRRRCGGRSARYPSSPSPSLPLSSSGLLAAFAGCLLLFVVSGGEHFAGTAFANAAAIGEPHSTVVTLTSEDFDDHLSDPANGLWFLKFYAPWCGHCKVLAPVLDKVAPYLAGKMSIGKVDCTVQKKVCSRFSIKGYPTLKFYRDGDFHDYSLGRDADSIIIFGEKMSRRAVSLVATHDEAKEKLLDKLPVAFVAYDPHASSSPDAVEKRGEEDAGEGHVANSAIDASGADDDEKEFEKYVRSTERNRVFGQVARKAQADSSFGMLRVVGSEGGKEKEEEVAKFFSGDDAEAKVQEWASNGFIARIEEGVPAKVYTGPMTSPDLLAFVKDQNLPVVLDLQRHNFRDTGRRGKPLAIAAYDTSPEAEVKTSKFQKEMKAYAVSGRLADEYVFATMDFKKWSKFLGQFDIRAEGLPEIFVLDVPQRTYWQDSEIWSVADFVEAHRAGDIAPRLQEKKKGQDFEDFVDVFVAYMPWTLLAVLALFALSFYLFLPPMESNRVIRPPMPTAMAEGADEDERKKDR